MPTAGRIVHGEGGYVVVQNADICSRVDVQQYAIQFSIASDTMTLAERGGWTSCLQKGAKLDAVTISLLDDETASVEASVLRPGHSYTLWLRRGTTPVAEIWDCVDAAVYVGAVKENAASTGAARVISITFEYGTYRPGVTAPLPVQGA